jgi:hypothetical protein
MKKTLTIIAILFMASCAALAQSEAILPAGWNPKAEGDKVLQRLIKVTGEQVKGAHDSEFAVTDGYAYVVAEVNDQRGGHGIWIDEYSSLSIVNLKTLTLERFIPFAKSEQVFENEKLPVGACWIPRIIQKDEKTMRCYFDSEQPGIRQSQMYYIDFNTDSRTFEKTVHRMKIKTEDGIFDMQPRYFYADAVKKGFQDKEVDFGFYLFDSFKTFENKIYVALNNYPGGQNGLGVMNKELDLVEVVGHFNEPRNKDARLTESSVNRLPDGTWMAICRNEVGTRNYMFTESKDGKTWETATFRDFVSNGTSSKPTFDKFNGIYYLGWQEATKMNGVNRSVFNIDVSRDGKNWERKYRFETEQSFQYPSFHQYQGHIWLTTSQGPAASWGNAYISFGMLE